mmetsp:Transcript_146243/g.364676  ORF Transcript_146243/g.364676 Transcript_146243/m.364676 type:complete len:242 (-) Transcript_146243:988-1713(-)
MTSSPSPLTSKNGELRKMRAISAQSCSKARILRNLMKTRMGTKRSELALTCRLRNASFFKFLGPSQNSKLSRIIASRSACQVVVSKGPSTGSTRSQVLGSTQFTVSLVPQMLLTETNVFTADLASAKRTSHEVGPRGPFLVRTPKAMLATQSCLDIAATMSAADARGGAHMTNTDKPSHDSFGGPGPLKGGIFCPRPNPTTSSIVSASTSANCPNRAFQRGNSKLKFSDTKKPLSAGLMAL